MARIPPRMRGKHLKCRLRPLKPRITPAHAGKTPPMPKPEDLDGDHPRLCGENCAYVTVIQLVLLWPR